MLLIVFTQLTLAESLYTNNHYHLAMIEYKRLFFCDNNLTKNLNLRLHYTIVTLHADYFNGYEEINKLLRDFPEIEPASKVILGIELIKSGNYYRATEILSETKEQRLLGLAYLCMGQYLKADEVWQKCDGNLKMEIEEFNRQTKKSPTRAMLFSAFIPGSGECYAGNIKQGISDFILTTLSGFLLYNAIKKEKYVDAGLVFVFLFNRFYFGSISNAATFAHNYNNKKEEEWLVYIKNKYFAENLKN